MLESQLTAKLQPTVNTYRAVSSFSQFVSEHAYYRNGYPLSAFAQALRAAFAHLGAPKQEMDEEPCFENTVVEEAIEHATSYIKANMIQKYVQRGKISLALFDVYLRTVHKILVSHFASDPDPVSSQFHALKMYLPTISNEVYMHKHRNILHYIFKLSRARMLDYLQGAI